MYQFMIVPHNATGGEADNNCIAVKLPPSRLSLFVLRCAGDAGLQWQFI
jgi:hypothetical protein